MTPREKTSEQTPDADMSIDVMIDSGLWKKHPGAEDIVRKAIAEATQAVPHKRAEMAVVLTDDSAMQALNKRWRGTDKPTNVLSFPAQATPAAAAAHLGDIVIAFETTALEAEREGKPFAHHLMHLVVHGYLHLLGHDHETDREAKAMERLETKILARIGIPDPYELVAEELVRHEAATLKSHA